MFDEVGKILVYFGVVLIIFGLLIILLSKVGNSLPIGKLPGDIYIKRDNFVFYFPLGTSILISLLLTGLSFLIMVLTRKQ